MRRKTHIAIRNIAEYTVRCACGCTLHEKDGFHSWADGNSRFWGMPFESVDCKRCIRLREEYLEGRSRTLNAAARIWNSPRV